jgi:hypothetical protein
MTVIAASYIMFPAEMQGCRSLCGMEPEADGKEDKKGLPGISLSG